MPNGFSAKNELCRFSTRANIFPSAPNEDGTVFFFEAAIFLQSLIREKSGEFGKKRNMTSKIVSNFLEKATFSVQYYHFPGGSEIFREKAPEKRHKNDNLLIKENNLLVKMAI